jgi:hypothetical protein
MMTEDHAGGSTGAGLPFASSGIDHRSSLTVGRLRFDMLADNYLIRDWLARCFPGAEYELDYGIVTMFVPLGPVRSASTAA